MMTAPMTAIELVKTIALFSKLGIFSVVPALINFSIILNINVFN